MFTEPQMERYTTETATVIFQGKPITLTNHTPLLTADQREKRGREIERTLYDVLGKYAVNITNS